MNKIILLGITITVMALLVPYSLNIKVEDEKAASANTEAIEAFDIESKKELIKSEWMVTEEDHKDLMGLDGVFIHNNGQPIKTGTLIEKRGNELFAVYLAVIGGETHTMYIYENRKQSDLATLKKGVAEMVTRAKEIHAESVKELGDTTSSIFKPLTASAHDIGRGGGWTTERWHLYYDGNYRGTFTKPLNLRGNHQIPR